MITLNLLPDVKKQFLRAQKIRNTIFLVALLTIAVSVGLLIFGYVATFAQRSLITSRENKIEDLSTQLREKEDLTRILTVKNQLEALPGLHEDKPQAGRLFSILELITPSDVDLSNVVVDVEDGTIEISGAAEKTVDVNTFADTIKNTRYLAIEKEDSDSEDARRQVEVFKASDNNDGKLVFGAVVTEPSISTEAVRFTITAEFEAEIFSNLHTVHFKVPKITTTHSLEPRKEGETLFDDELLPDEEASE